MQRHSLLIYHPGRAEQFVDAIRGRNDMRMLDVSIANDETELLERVQKIDILITLNSLPKGVLKHAPNLKWIHVPAAGVDGIVHAGVPERVQVTRTLGTFGKRMAEYVCCYMLAITQQTRQVIKQQEEQKWQPLSLSHLDGAVVGIAGVGNIGSVIAERLHQFGMRTFGLANEPKPLPYVDSWFSPDDIKSFVKDLDFLVITLPLTPATCGLFNRQLFTVMKPSAWLINIGRGQVVDEATLGEALQNGQIGGAVLDVFEEEPLAPDSPLWALDNVFVTPHHSGDALLDEVIDGFAINFKHWQRSETLIGQVNLERAY
jgi:glyoxylate/hydroxypyruvate reductase A